MYKYLSFIYENKFTKNIIAYLTLAAALVVAFSFTKFNVYWIIGHETSEYMILHNYLSQGLLPIIYFNGYLIYRFKFCDWSVLSWIIVLLYSVANYIEHEIGVMLPNWCVVAFNLIILILTIFAIMNLLKVKFKCCIE